MRLELTNALRLRPLMTYAHPHWAVQLRIALIRVHLALSDLAGARVIMREIAEIHERRPDLGIVTEEAEGLRTQLSRQRGADSPGASALTEVPWPARGRVESTGCSSASPKTAALLVLGAAVAIGTSSSCLRWSASRALAAGASEEEVTDVLLVIAPVAGLGRVVCAAPDLAAALGYDVEAALFDPDDS